MGISSSLYYLRLKVAAVLVRVIIEVAGFVRQKVLGTYIDWERSYPQVSREYSIKSSEGRSLKIRVWEPPTSFAGLRPVHINYHGSGYLIPSLGNDSDFCQLLSQRLGITVLDCDYSKAPEYPFPYAYNEIVDVLKHVLAQPGNYDLSNLTIGGFSAGAGLTACISANEKLAWDNVKGLVLTYPPGDLSNPPGPPPKGPPGSTAPVLSPGIIDLFNNSYSVGGYSLADPRISPLKADFTRFHGMVNVIVGEFDNLKAHGLELAEKMKKEGLKVNSTIIEGVGHAWDKTGRNGTWEHQRKLEAYEIVVSFLEGVYKAPKLQAVTK